MSAAQSSAGAGGASSVVFIRHGETDWNQARRFQGHKDVPLNAVGRTQAAAAALRFPTDGPTRLVSSDLRRAQETARHFSKVLGVDITLDPRFRETYGGGWEGLTHSEIQDADADTFKRWRSAYHVRPGGSGELLSEVADRVVAGVEQYLLEVPDGGRLVIVTHGGSTRAAIARMTGLPLAHLGAFAVLGNCATATLIPIGISEVPPSDGSRSWRVASYNL